MGRPGINRRLFLKRSGSAGIAALVGGLEQRKAFSQTNSSAPSASGPYEFYTFELKCISDPTGGIGVEKSEGGWGGVVDIEHVVVQSLGLSENIIPSLAAESFRQNTLRYQAALHGTGPSKGDRSPSFSFSILGSSVHEFSKREGVQMPANPFNNEGRPPISWYDKTILSFAAGGIPTTSKLGGQPPDLPMGDAAGTVTVDLTETMNYTGVYPQVTNTPAGERDELVTFQNVMDGGSGSGTWSTESTQTSASVTGFLQSAVLGEWQIAFADPNLKGGELLKFFSKKTFLGAALNYFTLEREGFSGKFGSLSCSWSYKVERRKWLQNPGELPIMLEDWQ